MKSTLENLLIKEKTIGTFKRLKYLKAEQDFPIGDSKKLRILRGNPSRALWCDRQVHCRSDDGITGYTKGGTNTPCKECKYLNGFEVEGRR